VTVRVLEVKLDRKQIALTMRSERAPGTGAKPPVAAGGGGRAPNASPDKPSSPFNNPFGALKGKSRG